MTNTIGENLIHRFQQVIQYKKLMIKLIILVTMLVFLITGITIFGCRGGTRNLGWSGLAIVDDTAFLGSTEGQMMALNIPGGNPIWEVTLETEETTGGLFGCAAAATPVPIYGTPVVDDDILYIGAYNGKIYAFRVGKDDPKWIFPRQGKLANIVGGPVLFDGKIYIGASDGYIYALDAAEGYEEWKFLTGNQIWATPTIVNDTLYIGSFDHKFYAININTHEAVWSPYETEGAIVTTPTVTDGTVYFGSFDRRIYALNTTTGTLKWKSSLAEKWFWAQPIVTGETVYAACLDGKLYVLDSENGSNLVDAIDLKDPISSSPVLIDDLIIIATENGTIWSINTATKQQKLLLDLEEKIHAPLTESNGIIYIHSQDEEGLYALNPRSGEILWSIPLTNEE